MGEREFVLLMGLLTALSALAIDIMLPAFSQMRTAFGLDDDSTRLSLTVTLFLMGAGVGHLFYGPIADAVGRKPALVGSLMLYAAAALTAALAPSLGVLYGSRFVWGFAAAGTSGPGAGHRARPLCGNDHGSSDDAHPDGLLHRADHGTRSWQGLGGDQLMALGDGFRRGDRTGGGGMDGAPRGDARPVKPPAAAAGAVLAGFRSVVSNRTALGYTLMVTFGFGAFLAYLGSTELILSDVYDRPGWFVPYFTVAGWWRRPWP